MILEERTTSLATQIPQSSIHHHPEKTCLDCSSISHSKQWKNIDIQLRAFAFVSLQKNELGIITRYFGIRTLLLLLRLALRRLIFCIYRCRADFERPRTLYVTLITRSRTRDAVPRRSFVTVRWLFSLSGSLHMHYRHAPSFPPPRLL